MAVDTIKWEDGRLSIIDQTLLPQEYVVKYLDTVEQVWEAVRKLRVRGAPAIGVAAAFGIVVGIKDITGTDRAGFDAKFGEITDYLASSRPTAVNLFWALDRMKKVICDNPFLPVYEIKEKLIDEAQMIMDEDKSVCRAIGRFGNQLVKHNCGILTHCNAGGLATVDYGTALGVVYAAHESGKNIKVYSDETRPLLQGSRLTAWELSNSGIDVTVICDNTAAKVMMDKKVDMVIVGADRIAKNGDTANKIGTYMVAISAKAHKIPFYVAAPLSTFDFNIDSGMEIPIEERDPAEVTEFFGKKTAPDGVKVYSPAFDVTPAELITAFITEVGILYPPFEESIAKSVKCNA